MAVAVAISGTNAVVTIENGDGGLSLQVFDVSAYVVSDSGNNCNSNQYLGSFDIEEGVMTLPGVALDDTIYTLIMERRGNSNNWKITFTEAVADTDDTGDDDSGDDDSGDD